MSHILRKNIVIGPRQAIPCQRNRLVVTYDTRQLQGFEQAGAIIQPHFQRRGVAYPMAARLRPNDTQFVPININQRGPVEAVCLALPLYDVKTRKAADAAQIDAFIADAGQIADSLTELVIPKGWFGRKSSTASLARPIIAMLDKARQDAITLATRYGTYINGLPAYQRHVEISVANAVMSPDEVAEFAEFCELGQPVAPGAWYDADLGVQILVSGSHVRILMRSVPATPLPEKVLENMHDTARRFQGEFGGELQFNATLSQQIVTGWRNVLSPLGLEPGDEEAAEFFPAL